MSLVWFCLVWFDSVWFGSVRFCSVLFGSVRLGSVRFGSVRFGLVRFGSVRFGAVRFEPAVRTGSVRFDSVRFGSVQFGGFAYSDNTTRVEPLRLYSCYILMPFGSVALGRSVVYQIQQQSRVRGYPLVRGPSFVPRDGSGCHFLSAVILSGKARH